MALTENLATENVQSNAITGATKGLDAGLAYAAAKQKSDQMTQELQMMSEKHEAQKSAYVIDQINKASQTDNKSLRKLYMDGADKSFQKYYGTPMSKDIKDFINNIPESNAGIQKLVEMYPTFASDPSQHAQFIGAFKSMFNSNLADAQKFASQIADQYNKLKAAETSSRRASQADERISQAERRLTGIESGRAQAALKNAQNAKPVQDAETQLLGAEKGLGIINQGIENYSKTGETITWSQLHEVTTDLAGLTSAKLSAVVPIARQMGIEKDIPKIAEFIGTVNREFKQGPDRGVPIKNLTALKSQFEAIRGVVKLYRDQQLSKRLEAGVASGVLPKETADKFSPESETPQQQTQSPQASQSPSDAAKSVKQKYKLSYSDFSAKMPNLASKVDEKTYNSL